MVVERQLRRVVRLVGARWMFVVTVLLFAIEAGWLAVTSRFPMPFDEAYHLGLIQFFSHHLNPIISQQASNTYEYGAIINNPSFLYHYLLSFPYRLLELFTKSTEIQVIGLRLVNVALAVATLVITRKTLRLLKLSEALANVIVFAFALTPIVSVLSAQLNYDNLLILLVSLCMYQLLTCMQGLREEAIDIKALLTLLALCLAASLVQFSFMPIFVATVIVIIWNLSLYHRRSGNITKAARQDFLAIDKKVRAGLLAVILIGLALFARFYIVNTVVYHNPVPQCNQVLSIPACQHYYAWNNNYTLLQYHQKHPTNYYWNPVRYTANWTAVSVAGIYGAILPYHGAYYRSQAFFVIVGVIGGVLLICMLVNFRQLFIKNTSLGAVTFVCLTYVLFLWGRNYHDYLHLDYPVAQNGRYLIPVLVYAYAALGLGLQHAVRELRTYAAPIKVGFATATIVSFLVFGGFIPYEAHIRPVYGHLSPTNSFVLPIIK